MGKPLVTATVFFIGGLVVGSRLAPPVLPLAAAGILLLIGLAAVIVRRRAVFCWLPPLCLFFFAAGWIRYSSARRLPSDHVAFLEAAAGLEIGGTVVGEPAFHRHGGEFVLRCRAARREAEPFEVSGKLLVKFHGAPGDIRNLVYPGGNIWVRARPVRPEERGNPGETSRRERLGARGVYRLTRAYGADVIRPAKEFSGGAWRRIAASWRRSLRAGLLSAYSRDALPTRHSLFLDAVLLGERRALPTGLRAAFREAGLAHLLAISGLHVGFIWLLGGLLFSPLPTRPRHLMIMALVGTYVFLTGARPPAVRAGVMAGVFSLAYILDQPRDLWAALSASALVILAVNPFAIFQVDFQFSFLIVAAIISLAPLFSRALFFLPRPLRPWAAVPLAAQAGAVPLTAHYFARFYPAALVANPIAVPLAGAAVNLGFISALLGMAWRPLGAAAGYPNRFLIDLLIGLSSRFAGAASRLPAVFHLPAAETAAALGMIFCAGAAFRLRRPALLLALPVFLAAAALSGPRRRPPLEIVFFNGSSGDFTLAFLPGGETVLVAPDGDGFGEIPKLVAPRMRRAGARKIDYLVLTGVGLNRLDSLVRLTEGFRVERILDHPAGEFSPTHELLLKTAESAGIEYRQVAAGDRLRIGETRLTFLWPPEEAARAGEAPASMALRLDYGEVGVLLAERLEAPVQLKLLQRFGPGQADVLKVPMKGSRAHFRPEFAAAVSPGAALLVQGRKYFGRHSVDCGPEFEALGAEVYLTSRDGALILQSDGREWSIRKGLEEKQARWRYAE